MLFRKEVAVVIFLYDKHAANKCVNFRIRMRHLIGLYVITKSYKVWILIYDSKVFAVHTLRVTVYSVKLHLQT